MHRLTQKFKKIKYVVIKWERSRKDALKQDLVHIETHIALLFDGCFNGVFTKRESLINPIGNREGSYFED